MVAPKIKEQHQSSMNVPITYENEINSETKTVLSHRMSEFGKKHIIAKIEMDIKRAKKLKKSPKKPPNIMIRSEWTFGTPQNPQENEYNLAGSRTSRSHNKDKKKSLFSENLQPNHYLPQDNRSNTASKNTQFLYNSLIMSQTNDDKDNLSFISTTSRKIYTINDLQ